MMSFRQSNVPALALRAARRDWLQQKRLMNILVQAQFYFILFYLLFYMCG